MTENKRLIRTIGDLSEPVSEMEYDKPVTVCKDGIEYDIDVLIYDDDKLIIVVGAKVIE